MEEVEVLDVELEVLDVEVLDVEVLDEEELDEEELEEELDEEVELVEVDELDEEEEVEEVDVEVEVATAVPHHIVPSWIKRYPWLSKYQSPATGVGSVGDTWRTLTRWVAPPIEPVKLVIPAII